MIYYQLLGMKKRLQKKLLLKYNSQHIMRVRPYSKDIDQNKKIYQN